MGIEGEISNFRPSAAGHWYFTLKDEHAQISAVMFKYRNMKTRFTPRDGMNVRAIGTVSVYEKRGIYQIICEALEEAGTGALLMKLEALKQRLFEEGLFAPEQKRPIPAFPKTVGVITSSTGAALRDILNVLKRRHSGIRVVIYPASVQGEAAAGELVSQLEEANRRKDADVLIIGRGGGSLEDLLPFSDEHLIRAVASSEIPVISAVGHEVDWALCDYAADVRSPTPSAAAEMVSSTREEIVQKITREKQSLTDFITRRLEQYRMQLEKYQPEELRERFEGLIRPYRQETDELIQQLQLQMQQRLQQAKHRLSLAEQDLRAHSPQAVLDRGFAVVRREADGQVLTSSRDCPPPQQVHITFARGSARAEIKESKP